MPLLTIALAWAKAGDVWILLSSSKFPDVGMVDKYGMPYRRLLEKPVRKAHLNIQCGGSVSVRRGFTFGPNVPKPSNL